MDTIPYFITSKVCWKDLAFWILLYLVLLLFGLINHSLSGYKCWQATKDNTFIGNIITLWEHVFYIFPILLFIDVIRLLLSITHII